MGWKKTADGSSSDEKSVYEHEQPKTGDIDVAGDHGADTELRRLLSTRHLTMIALGSSIGMGLWLGSGISLTHGGPAGIFLGYCLASSMIWSVNHSIGEMATLYPLPSAFVQWTGKFVCPSTAFALGWAYLFSYIITIANELQGVVTVLHFWTHAVSTAAWITIIWVVIICVNIGAVTLFGEVEVVAATIKFGWIFVVIISLIGAPKGGAIGFSYWNSVPFAHGFKGFLDVMPTCIFAMAGSENAGLVAAEASNPRKAVPRAIGSIWLGLSLFYLLGSLMVTITVYPGNPDLFGGSGTNASPFVIAYRDAGLEPLAHMMNAVIFISILSTGSISGYGGSRTTLGLAHLGMAPKQFGRANKVGRPWLGLPVTLSGGLAYLNVSNSSANVFTWFSNLTSLFTLFGWGLICLSHIRMRYAWRIQGRLPSELPWKSWTYPYAAWWSLSWCIILMIVEFYLAVWPLGEKSSAKTFFENYVSVIVILVIYLGARIYHRVPWWVDASTIDLDAQRRFYVDCDTEKGCKKGITSKASKVVGIVLN